MYVATKEISTCDPISLPRDHSSIGIDFNGSALCKKSYRTNSQVPLSKIRSEQQQPPSLQKFCNHDVIAHNLAHSIHEHVHSLLWKQQLPDRVCNDLDQIDHEIRTAMVSANCWLPMCRSQRSPMVPYSTWSVHHQILLESETCCWTLDWPNFPWAAQAYMQNEVEIAPNKLNPSQTSSINSNLCIAP